MASDNDCACTFPEPERPSDMDFLQAERDHIQNPQSDFEYGHSFKREGDACVCRCGFRIEAGQPERPAVRVAEPEGWCFDCGSPVTNECVKNEHGYQLAVTQEEYSAMSAPVHAVGDSPAPELLIESAANAIMDEMERVNREQGQFSGALPREAYLPTMRRFAKAALSVYSTPAITPDSARRVAKRIADDLLTTGSGRKGDHLQIAEGIPPNNTYLAGWCESAIAGRVAEIIQSELGTPAISVEGAWQPIETAPKGTVSVLLGAVGCDIVETGYAEFGDTLCTDNHAPTHWRPLPPAPVAQAVRDFKSSPDGEKGKE